MEQETEPEASTESMSDEIVEGTVRQVTCADNFIVYPTSSDSSPNDVREGNPVRFIVPGKGLGSSRFPSLEARREPMTSPVASEWAIIVTAYQAIESCIVFYNGVRLGRIDHMGELRTEVSIPQGESCAFHIPSALGMNDSFSVQVRDGNRLLRSEQLDSIRSIALEKEPRVI